MNKTSDFVPDLKCFTPNGIVTEETCPVCDTLAVKVEHGHKTLIVNGKVQKTNTCQHYWHCSECGDELVIVGYDCELCRGQHG